MKFDYIVYVFVIGCTLSLISAKRRDRPCLSRSVRHRSPVCVCNAKYCDTISREKPNIDNCYIYVSSEAGLRFKKSSEPLQPIDEAADSDVIFELDPTKEYQTILGFGGGITDATGINWKSLKDGKLMDHFIKSYCGSAGIEYNMLRVPIGSTDFSTRAYAYNELPENDVTLSNYSLAYEDYEYKLPMIKECMDAAGAPLNVVTSTGSPPLWMKDSVQTRLKQEYLQTYATYHSKFIDHYTRYGVPIWGIITSNEPRRFAADYNIENPVWTMETLNQWIVNNMVPTLRNSTFKDVKIILGDDQRNTINQDWFTLTSKYLNMLEYLSGIATNIYVDRYLPILLHSETMRQFSDKFIINMIASGNQGSVQVDLGSWERAERYFRSMMEILNNNASGWLDWNMALNSEGGPSWTNTRADSPIIINAAAGEFYKQPMYYAIGHYSKFLPRGSKRIHSQSVGKDSYEIQIASFVTPKKTIVVVIDNKGNRDEVKIRYGGNEVEVGLKAKSFTTVEIPLV